MDQVDYMRQTISELQKEVKILKHNEGALKRALDNYSRDLEPRIAGLERGKEEVKVQFNRIIEEIQKKN